MAAVGQCTPLCVASPSPRVKSATCNSNLSPTTTTVSSRTELAAFRPQFRLFSRVSPSRRRLYASSPADSGIFLPHLVASMVKAFPPSKRYMLSFTFCLLLPHASVLLYILKFNQEQVEETYIMVKPDGIQRGLVSDLRRQSSQLWSFLT